MYYDSLRLRYTDQGKPESKGLVQKKRAALRLMRWGCTRNDNFAPSKQYRIKRQGSWTEEHDSNTKHYGIGAQQ